MNVQTSQQTWKAWDPTTNAPWNLRRVIHLHRRAGFAPDWSGLKRDVSEGHQASIDRLLHGNSTTNKSDNEFESLSDVIRDAAVASGDINRLKAWWIFRMLKSPRPVVERLTLMWHNHFATSNVKVGSVELMRRQNDLLRQFAMAEFSELLKRVSSDPAMLIWLDAAANRKEHPNENFAREVMELFSLGEGNYTESDVKEAARALTGWSVRKNTFRNYPKYHDDEEKTIFAKTGKWDGDDFIGMLLEHPATPRRLAFRICEKFMGEGVTTDQ